MNFLAQKAKQYLVGTELEQKLISITQDQDTLPMSQDMTDIAHRTMRGADERSRIMQHVWRVLAEERPHKWRKIRNALELLRVLCELGHEACIEEVRENMYLMNQLSRFQCKLTEQPIALKSEISELIQNRARNVILLANVEKFLKEAREKSKSVDARFNTQSNMTSSGGNNFAISTVSNNNNNAVDRFGSVTNYAAPADSGDKLGNSDTFNESTAQYIKQSSNYLKKGLKNILGIEDVEEVALPPPSGTSNFDSRFAGVSSSGGNTFQHNNFQHNSNEGGRSSHQYNQDTDEEKDTNDNFKSSKTNSNDKPKISIDDLLDFGDKKTTNNKPNNVKNTTNNDDDFFGGEDPFAFTNTGTPNPTNTNLFAMPSNSPSIPAPTTTNASTTNDPFDFSAMGIKNHHAPSKPAPTVVSTGNAKKDAFADLFN